jgi:hypothetical protein
VAAGVRGAPEKQRRLPFPAPQQHRRICVAKNKIDRGGLADASDG